MRAAISRINQLIESAAERDPASTALILRDQSVSYGELDESCSKFASAAMQTGLAAGGRVGVFLPKQFETVIALFGTSAAGGAFVPINPVLKPAQVAHIVGDCDVNILVTSLQRYELIRDSLAACESLMLTVLVDGDDSVGGSIGNEKVVGWDKFLQCDERSGHSRIVNDMAAILYTSGSTGKPKGVVLSHGNMIAGAESVSTYLNNTAEDRILAVLPLSFDAGLSQLTTAFNAGATAVLMDYLLPRDVLRAVERYAITGLAAVPPLWNQLVQLEWPQAAREGLRYITNTGGAMPVGTTRKLRETLPNTEIFLMYGLTEAFRSTYLPPEEVDRIPESIGKAIPNAEIMVVNDDGNECAVGEPGELVHRGNLVALGYWNNPEKTAERFRPVPGQDHALPFPEIAVWSGDRVTRDKDGYLYFVARQDEMIKTSGYRVSPTEIEELAYGTGLVTGAAALGVPHAMLGQAIVLAVATTDGAEEVTESLRSTFGRELPGFMQPQRIEVRASMPHNQNGKIDRRALHEEYAAVFTEEG